MSRHVLVKTAAAGAVAGAVIGGAVSAAKQYRDFKDGKVTKEKAAENTVKEAAGTGLATAAGAAVAGTLGLGLFASLAAFTVVSAGMKYLWDSKVNECTKEECTTEQGDLS